MGKCKMIFVTNKKFNGTLQNINYCVDQKSKIDVTLTQDPMGKCFKFILQWFKISEVCDLYIFLLLYCVFYESADFLIFV